MQLTVPLGILVHLGEVIVKSCRFFHASAMQHNEFTKPGFLRSLAQLYMMGLKMNLKRKRETSLSVSASRTHRCHSSFREWFIKTIICFVLYLYLAKQFSFSISSLINVNQLSLNLHRRQEVNACIVNHKKCRGNVLY